MRKRGVCRELQLELSNVNAVQDFGMFDLRRVDVVLGYEWGVDVVLGYEWVEGFG